MKTICAIIAILFLANCTSLQQKTQDVVKPEDESVLNITYDKSSGQSIIRFSQDDEKQLITLTNKQKNKSWTISYKDFKIMTLGYKNWRVVEGVKPEISKITEDANWLNFTFNYYKLVKAQDGTEARVSILSGTVSISKKVIRTNEEEASKRSMKWWIVGLSSYSALITTILLIVVL